jgi:cell pole-organizing protein PopZ
VTPAIAILVEAMSDAKGQQHEPSMEEILASIRRIIAEDGDAPAPAGAAPAGAAAAPAASGAAAPAAPAAASMCPSPAKVAPQEDVLELTEVVEPDGSVVSLNAPPPKPAAPKPAPPKPVLVEMPAPAPPPRMAEAASDEADDHEAMVSAATAAASVAALSQIASLSQRDGGHERDIPLGAGHLTLEALVRDELRPILKDWLDNHLAALVERLVADEIARLVRDVQRR